MGIIKNLFKAFGGGTATPNMAMGGQSAEFDEDYSEFVNKEFAERQAERKSYELQWRLNAEFVDGNQYLDINSVSNTIEEVPKLFWYQNREVFNNIAPIMETRVSKLSRQKPSLRTRPASSDDVDVSSAKVTSMLLGSSWADQGMDESYEDFISWLEMCGTAFWKTSWNKNRGRILFQGQQQAPMAQPQQAPMAQPQQDPMNPMPPQPQQDPMNPLMQGDQPQPITPDDSSSPLSNEDGSPIQQGGYIELREGDLETTVVPAFEIFPDSSSRRGTKDCRSIIHAKAYHVQEIAEIWGQEVEPEKVDVMSLQRVTSSGGGGLGNGSSSFRTSSKTMKNTAVVKEYYERPSLKFPQGRLIVVAGNKTLYAGPLPYKLGRDEEFDFPFVRCVSIDRPGCFWGHSVIERCIGIQRRYNALRNRKGEYLNMVAIGQWYVPIGSVDEGTELNNAPGNLIHYRPGAGGAKPEPVFWPNLPASFEQEEATLMHEFTAVSGVSELARMAEAPVGVKSGIALAQATEQDDTRLASSVSRIANATVDIGKKWLRLYRQFVQEPRVLRYIGGNREADVREWELSDLRSDDVYIENMAALSSTPASRRQMVFDLLNAGLFVRPEMSTMTEEGRQKVFQMLEMGHWESWYEDDHYLQKSRARRENRDMMAGQMVHVMDFDDHELHVAQHNRMRMQAEWDELMKMPEGQIINTMMMQHIAEHIQYAIQAMPKQPVDQTGKPVGTASAAKPVQQGSQPKSG